MRINLSSFSMSVAQMPKNKWPLLQDKKNLAIALGALAALATTLGVTYANREKLQKFFGKKTEAEAEARTELKVNRQSGKKELTEALKYFEDRCLPTLEEIYASGVKPSKDEPKAAIEGETKEDLTLEHLKTSINEGKSNPDFTFKSLIHGYFTNVAYLEYLSSRYGTDNATYKQVESQQEAFIKLFEDTSFSKEYHLDKGELKTIERS